MPYFYSYKPESKSVSILSEMLGFKKIKHNSSSFKPNPKKTVINWGSSNLPDHVLGCNIINPPELLNEAVNKLRFFQKMDAAGLANLCVPYTTSKEVVKGWLNDGNLVVVRQKLTGHSGEGIIIISGDCEIPDAKLYTLYQLKKDEYRVHVCKNGVFDIQQKMKVRDRDNVNYQIRNHQNGFIYGRNNIKYPSSIQDAALKIFSATGLDFAAIDIIYNNRKDRAWVLEVNSAPGLEGQSVEIYAEMLRGLV